MNTIGRIVAYVLLAIVYTVTWLVAVAGHAAPRRRWKPNGRILVTGTFFNPNWYLSHVMPLTRSGVKEVILVIDEPQQPLDQVRFVCPPRWLAKLISRAGAKALWMIYAGLRYRPDLCMGYHIVPGACSALTVGSLLGRPACYQMTAGPIEIEGGGFAAVGTVAGTLEQPSRCIERLVWAVVRQFEFIVVRGRGARKFLADHGFSGQVSVITGSVRDFPAPGACPREIDMTYVGRLSPEKQVDQFIAIVQSVSRSVDSIRAAIVGNGPLRDYLQEYAIELGVSERIVFHGKIVNVSAVLARSKLFILNSQTEGLSIAMAEAMAAGAVPIVPDVGELRDLVRNGQNGYLVSPNCLGEYTSRVRSLLEDHALWEQLSGNAIEDARRCCHVEAVANRWRGLYQKALDLRVEGGRGGTVTEDMSVTSRDNVKEIP